MKFCGFTKGKRDAFRDEFDSFDQNVKGSADLFGQPLSLM